MPMLRSVVSEKPMVLSLGSGYTSEVHKVHQSMVNEFRVLEPRRRTIRRDLCMRGSGATLLRRIGTKTEYLLCLARAWHVLITLDLRLGHQ